MTDSAGRITVGADGPVGHVVLDHEARLNALTHAMWQAIPGAIRTLVEDPAIRVIVLSGAGDKAFAAGADISEFERRRETPAQAAGYGGGVSAACDAIAEAPKPTIAMIRGVCYGGGMGIALSCDLRIAGDDARIAITAARLGIGYPFDGMKRLVDVAGPSVAKMLMFTGSALGAEEAREAGLVDRVVPAAELRAFVTAYAGRIAENAPLSVAAAKLCIDAALAPEADRDLAACRAAIERCMASADYAEGRRAFIEKRKPVFRGE